MSRPFLTYLAINTFTTILMTTFYNFYLKKTSKQDEKLEFLLTKIKQLEESVHSLQQSIEDIEENINKNNSIIESNIVLNNKLDDFINYSYEVYSE
jgi:peptidoglycan hydrolase CwlO-like protein